MKHSDYWKKRFELLEQSQNNIGLQCFANIEKQYRQAQKQLEGQLLAWYQRFATNNSITIQEARKMLTSKELEELKWDINDYIRYGKENAINGTWVKQLENASAKFHISRLEALKLQTQQSMEVMFGNQLDSIDSTIRNIYTSGYYHTAFEIQKGIGVGWDFAGLDEKQISKVINTPWAADGKNFSERIWGNGQKLINELNTDLTRNIILGQDPQKAIDAIARKMQTSKNTAGKLVMTEEAFFSSAAQQDSFNELGVDKYEIVATLDSHTSEICRELDGKGRSENEPFFYMSEYEVGVTAPPFHIYCRTTTAPYFGDEFDIMGERAARGEDGKTYYVPADTKYNDWKKSFVDGEDKSGLQEIKHDDKITVESKFKKLAKVDSFSNDADRESFAESIIDALGVNRSDVPIKVERLSGARGACSFYSSVDKGVCNYIKYSLQKGDNRTLPYQIKTAFHESYHFSLQSHEWDAVKQGKLNPKWIEIEEVFAESSAHYALKVYGFSDIAPSYAEKLIRTLPRLKQLPQFNKCDNVLDFGKIAWEDRLSGNGGVWSELYDKVFSIPLNEKEYYGKYFKYIRDNDDSLVSKMLENMPEASAYKNEMKNELKAALEKVEQGSSLSALTGNEKMVFNNVLINAMMQKGVY